MATIVELAATSELAQAVYSSLLTLGPIDSERLRIVQRLPGDRHTPSLNPQFLALQPVIAQWVQSGALPPGSTFAGHSLGGYLAVYALLQKVSIGLTAATFDGLLAAQHRTRSSPALSATEVNDTTMRSRTRRSMSRYAYEAG
jgi:hypothetical protein